MPKTPPADSRIPGKAPALSDLSNELGQLAAIATNARTTFLGIALACAYSFLTLFTTTDAELLANSSSSTLPVIDAQIPIVGFFVVMPIALTFAYFYFHMYLQGFWRCASRLPPRSGENTPIDDYVYPWMISSSLVRSYAAVGALGKRPMWRVEKAATVVLCWWLVPVTLTGFWLRYLMAHHWWVTALHVTLLTTITAGGIYFYRMAVATLRRDEPRAAASWRDPNLLRPLAWTASTAGVLLLFSFGSIEGAPEHHCEEGVPGCDGRFAAGRWLGRFGLSSAGLENVEVSTRPPEWSGTPETLLQELRPLRGANLAGSNLRHGRANHAFLAAADLVGADLSWIELEDASLQGANLRDARLRGAFLEGARLQHAVLTDAVLSGADLENANIQGATLDGAHFDEACLFGADLTGAHASRSYFDTAELTKATLDQAHLYKAQLKFAKLGFASLKGTDFSQADLRGADLRGADLTGATLRKASLVRAFLRDSNLSQASADHVDLRRSNLVAANLQQAKLAFAEIGGADLTDAEISGADFTGADFSRATLDRVRGHENTRLGFEAANLRQVNMFRANARGAQLAGVNLFRADLRASDFSMANLDRTDLRTAVMKGIFLKGADVRGADLSGADLSGAKLNRSNFTDAAFGDAKLAQADLGGTNFTRVDLSQVRGLTVDQLRKACGVGARLPSPGFERFSLAPCSRS